MQTHGARGFTLVEVTLSIVIGIILIAGATLLYQQAKLGAGNTRAKAKVIAVQGMVEEIMADNGGTVPAPAAVYQRYVQTRDDAAQSPWGGTAATNTDPGALIGQPGFFSYTFSPGTAYPAGQNTSGTISGCIQYDVPTTPPTATSSWWDRSIWRAGRVPDLPRQRRRPGRQLRLVRAGRPVSPGVPVTRA